MATLMLTYNHYVLFAGAYTTARTVQGNLVFKLSSHIQRLATSANLMVDADMTVRVTALRVALFSSTIAYSNSLSHLANSTAATLQAVSHMLRIRQQQTQQLLGPDNCNLVFFAGVRPHGCRHTTLSQ